MQEKRIDFEPIYECFKAGLSHCGVFLLELSDEDIEWHLFEEFDTDCVSFLHESTLNQLLKAGKITPYVADMSLMLSRRFRALENTSAWDVSAVRSSPVWLELFLLSDKIKKYLSS